MSADQCFLWIHVDVERGATAVLSAPIRGEAARSQLQESCSCGRVEGETQVTVTDEYFLISAFVIKCRHLFHFRSETARADVRDFWAQWRKLIWVPTYI